jgi:hypothetical protein
MYGQVRGIVGSSLPGISALELEPVAGMLEDMTVIHTPVGALRNALGFGNPPNHPLPGPARLAASAARGVAGGRH